MAKLLKLIEEPPENTYLIFVSNDQSKILPTISSRLQTINVPRLKDENISATGKNIELYHTVFNHAFL